MKNKVAIIIAPKGSLIKDEIRERLALYIHLNRHRGLGLNIDEVGIIEHPFDGCDTTLLMESYAEPCRYNTSAIQVQSVLQQPRFNFFDRCYYFLRGSLKEDNPRGDKPWFSFDNGLDGDQNRIIKGHFDLLEDAEDKLDQKAAIKELLSRRDLLCPVSEFACSELAHMLGLSSSDFLDHLVEIMLRYDSEAPDWDEHVVNNPGRFLVLLVALLRNYQVTIEPNKPEPVLPSNGDIYAIVGPSLSVTCTLNSVYPPTSGMGRAVLLHNNFGGQWWTDPPARYQQEYSKILQPEVQS